MQRQLYPTDVIEHSIEEHIARHSRPSNAIYLTVLLLFGVAGASLAFIRVNVSVQSQGIVRPALEKHEVRAPVSGFVDSFPAFETQDVPSGALLLRVRDPVSGQRLTVGDAELERRRQFILDVTLLASAEEPGALGADDLRTPRYRQELARFQNDLEERRLEEERAARAVERSSTLYGRGLGSLVDLEDREFELARIRAAGQLRLEEYRREWQSELTRLRSELEEARLRQEQVQDDHRRSIVRAPVGGTLEQVAPLSPGSFVRAGDVVAVISPHSELIAEVYIAPRSVGLISEGSPVRMQIDAFNYRDWGIVTGHVSSLAEDFVLIDQKPVFRAWVTLDQTALRLKNGYQGTLKKGMTLQARFRVARRSLLQLLKDDMNDWLDPTAAPDSRG